MISPSLIDTQIEPSHGRAMVEVDQIYPQNSIRVQQDGFDRPAAESRPIRL